MGLDVSTLTDATRAIAAIIAWKEGEINSVPTGDKNNPAVAAIYRATNYIGFKVPLSPKEADE